MYKCVSMEATMEEKQKSGAIFILLAAIMFSMGGLMIKIVPWQPLSIIGARNIFAVVITFIYIKIIKHKIVFNLSVLLGSLGMIGTTTLFVFANKMTTAANTIILQYTAPIYIILFMWLFYKQRPKRLDIATCVVVVLGTLCFFIDSLSTGNMLGNFLALASGVTYAVVFMVNMFKGSSPLSSFFWGQLISAVAFSPFVLTETDFSVPAIAGVAFLGVFQYGLAYIFMSLGLKSTNPVTASLVASIEPILNPVLVAIFYGEVIGGLSIVGAIIVFLAISAYNLLNMKKTQNKPT